MQRNVDMCNGRLLPNIIKYAIPLMLTGLLQLLYNAADVIVVAKWAGGTALAAVGSNGSLINLIVNVFVGLSVGATVAVSHYYGAGDKEQVSQSVHTAMSLSLLCGIATAVIGTLVARPALELMNSPAEVIDQATLYLRIYFLGTPFAMIYNFGAAILRAVGDTKRPLYILTLSGLINVGLNLLLVIVFRLDVAGVAIATSVSQLFSAVMVVICLMRSFDCYRLELKKLRIVKDKLLLILRHGIPAGVQSSIFSISNIILQSSINGFGAAATAGSAAAVNLEGFAYIAMNAMQHATLAFIGQNIGAKQPKRLGRILVVCLLCVTVIGVALDALLLLFREPLLSLYTATSSVESAVSPADVMRYGISRIMMIVPLYFTCGIMDVLGGALRGMGASMAPTLISILGVCGIRIAWVYTVFPWFGHTYELLFLSYPLSWIATAMAQGICLLFVYRKTVRRLQQEIDP